VVYCTRDDLEPFMENPSRFNEELRDSAIEAAGDFIEILTEDQFHQQTEVRTFDGQGRRLLVVSPSLWAVTGLTVTDPWTGDVDTLDSDEYRWGKGWISMRGANALFTSGKANISVNGTWGWKNTPPMLRILSARLAAAFLTGKNMADVVEERLGDYGVKYAQKGDSDTSNAAVLQMIDTYRLHPVVMERVRGERTTLRDFDETPREELRD